MGSFKSGKLKEGYIDFHNTSYNEKITPVEGWYTPDLVFFFVVVVFCKHSDFHENFGNQ